MKIVLQKLLCLYPDLSKIGIKFLELFYESILVEIWIDIILKIKVLLSIEYTTPFPRGVHVTDCFVFPENGKLNFYTECYVLIKFW